MNAAARTLSSGTWFRGNVKQIAMNKEGLFATILLVAVLLSALVVVYVKNEQRVAFSELQSATQQADQLDLEWNQLMLEQSALGAPARVQRIAHQHLHMIMPKPERIILVRPNVSS